MNTIHFLPEHTVEEWQINKATNTVKGVRYTNNEGNSEEIAADLFVEASGRGSRIDKALDTSGYGKVAEEKVEVNVVYIGQTFNRTPDENCKAIFIFPEAPKETRMGIMLPIENNRWHVSMVGYIGDHPTNTSEGLLQFAKSLPQPDIYDALCMLKPESDVTPFRFPADMRKYYERMAKPDNLIIIGDAICNFNPVYGQGMCIAALESEVLDQSLIENTTLAAASQQYFKKITPIIANAWQTAIGEDLRYPALKGSRSVIIKFAQWYLIQIFQISSYNAKVCAAFYEVQTCIAQPTKLFSPSTVFKVLLHSSGLRGKFKPVLERPFHKSEINPLNQSEKSHLS
jgi:flavin-dependent dehydrogenase